MGLPDLDSAIAATFGLEMDNVVIKQIREVSGLKMEQDVIELKQNTPDGKFVIKKLPGKPKAGEITLTRPLTGDNSFEKWCKDARLGKMSDARKGGAIILYDQEGNEFKRYKLTNAWPKSLEISNLKAGSTEPADEKIVIVYESMEPESKGG
jgi:phage tail-like protein